MNTFTQIMYDEIQRAENMLANYVGLPHGALELDTFRPESYSNVNADVKRIVLALQVLPVPANASQELAARYMNLADSLCVAVTKPRMHKALLLARDIEGFLSDSVFTTFLRHVMMVALAFAAIQMPSKVAQVVTFIAMLSAGLAGGRLSKKSPGQGMAAGYIACMVGYGVGAVLAQDGQTVMGGAAGVWVVTTVIAIASVITTFCESEDNVATATDDYEATPAIGSYLDPLTLEYSSIDVGGSIKLL